MGNKEPYYCGNAAADQIGGSGWFVGQFVPSELGLRHQADVEVKWGMHRDGDKRSRPWANGNGTTIAVLIRGTLRVSLYAAHTPDTITLAREGDYIIYGPEVVHSWEAVGDTLVLSIRFPSVEVDRTREGVVAV
ncbi:MAG: signal peptidase I [Alphaproteobacteria bacterium]|nr:signal peptidase I [Alphaproteobacteria bacterium]